MDSTSSFRFPFPPRGLRGQGNDAEVPTSIRTGDDRSRWRADEPVLARRARRRWTRSVVHRILDATSFLSGREAFLSFVSICISNKGRRNPRIPGFGTGAGREDAVRSARAKGSRAGCASKNEANEHAKHAMSGQVSSPCDSDSRRRTCEKSERHLPGGEWIRSRTQANARKTT